MKEETLEDKTDNIGFWIEFFSPAKEILGSDAGEYMRKGAEIGCLVNGFYEFLTLHGNFTSIPRYTFLGCVLGMFY